MVVEPAARAMRSVSRRDKAQARAQALVASNGRSQDAAQKAKPDRDGHALRHAQAQAVIRWCERLGEVELSV